MGLLNLRFMSAYMHNLHRCACLASWVTQTTLHSVLSTVFVVHKYGYTKYELYGIEKYHIERKALE